jgi:AraC-like DNA-binding protein
MNNLNPPACDRVYKKIFDDHNRIDFTCLNSFYSEKIFNHFNIKYVYRGVEHYKTESGEFDVKEDDILYSSSQTGSVHINNKDKSTSIGLCIHLSKDYLSQLLDINELNCFETDPDDSKGRITDFQFFLEGLDQHKNSHAVKVLHNLCESVERGEPFENLVNFDWLLSFAEIMVKEKSESFNAFSKIPSKKNSTKKEILKRLMLAKQFMDDVFLEHPSIPEIARISLLSEYHFYRSFKSAFGISPYRYLLNKRLEFAKELIQNQNAPIQIAASLSGFSDQFAFSKAFKARFKARPSYFKPKEEPPIGIKALLKKAI